MSIIRVVLIFLLTSFGTVHAGDSDANEAIVIEMQSVASTFVKSLGKTLKATIKSEGLAAAIHVCETVAPTLANQLSRETGWRVSRVSLKFRNPLIGMPDAWEKEQLINFSNAPLSNNTQSDVMEVTSIEENSEGHSIRYMRALPTKALCLTCHGKSTDIPNEVSSALEQFYPNDKATGYSLGQIRGAISIQTNRD